MAPDLLGGVTEGVVVEVGVARGGEWLLVSRFPFSKMEEFRATERADIDILDLTLLRRFLLGLSR